MPAPILPPIGPDLRQWGRQLSLYLQQNLAKLGFKTATDNPSENGVILWDEVNGYPVVSKNGEFRQIVLEDGQYAGGVTTDQTAASTNTAYALTYTSSSPMVLQTAHQPHAWCLRKLGNTWLAFRRRLRPHPAQL